MTRDIWAIIGTMVTIGSIIVALGAIAVNQNSQRHTRISDLRNEMNTRFNNLEGNVDNVRTDVRRIDDRLLAAEIGFGKIEQRLLTLEHAIIPAAESNE